MKQDNKEIQKSGKDEKEKSPRFIFKKYKPKKNVLASQKDSHRQ